MNAVQIACPQCAARARVDERSIGRRARCGKCGHSFTLAAPGSGSGSGTGTGSQPTMAARVPGDAPDIPEQFGRYRILSLLGRGGMGAVYLAQDTRLDRRVALKIPYFESHERAEAIRRFEREARAAATLDHPNLCPVYDVGEVDGAHYLTMPYIEGEPFARAYPRGAAMPEVRAAALARTLALALGEAHARGVVHRDLKPGNILVNRRGDPVIMDFGLARVVDGGHAPITRSGLVLGTALYMAPEQATGEEFGPSCDIYALGVILYELLTGSRPFEGPWSLVIGLKSVREPEPPSAHRPDLSPALDRVCRKAIAQKPADRYATMAEFAAALEKFLGQPPAPGPIGTADYVSQVFSGVVIPQEVSLRGIPVTSGRPADPPARTRARVGAAVAGLAFLGIIAVGAALQSRGRPGAAAAGSGAAAPAHAPPAPKPAPPPARPPGPAPAARADRSSSAPARPLIPPTGRKATAIRGTGRWSIEGEDLILSSGEESEQALVFGDDLWTDYVFQFDARCEGDATNIRTLYRVGPDGTLLQYTFGINYGGTGFGPNTALVERYIPGSHGTIADKAGKTLIRKVESPTIEPGRWHAFRVLTRGTVVRAYFDGKLILETDRAPLDRGRVGVGGWIPGGVTGSTRLVFRRFEVRALDNSLLWDGLPELPDPR